MPSSVQVIMNRLFTGYKTTVLCHLCAPWLWKFEQNSSEDPLSMPNRHGQFEPTVAFRKREQQLRGSVEAETVGQLIKDISKLFKDVQYSDLQLYVNSRQLPVHSCLLKARYEQFYNYCVEHVEDDKVVINELSFDQLERCLSSVYTKDSIDCSEIDKALSLKASKQRSLSDDLLQLFDGGSGDVEFIVEEKVVQAHKAVLASRSEYFAAMFSEFWKETSLSSVTIMGTRHGVFVAVLKFLYSGCEQDMFSQKTNELLQFSDMYGIVGVQKLIINHLKITKCHLFHKPCKHCIPQVHECLKLCESFYVLESLKSLCIQWMSKHFVKTLACKQFMSMSEKSQSDVKLEIEKQLDSSTAVETWRKCNKLISSVDNCQTEWARLLQDYVRSIQATCLNVTIENFVPICNSCILDNFLKEVNYSGSLLEQFFNAVLEKLTIQNCCTILQGFLILVEMGKHAADNVTDFFGSETFAVVEKSCKKCEKFVIGRIGQVSKTKAWQTISDLKQKELKDAGLFVDL